MTLAQPPHMPAPVDPLRMTEQEYLDWADESGRTEWVAGEVIWKVPISDLHDLLQAAIRSSLEALVRRRGLGHVRGEKWAMRLPQRPSWREADIVFIAKDTTSELTHNKLVGPADMAMEIVSPGSSAQDYRVKFAEYEAAGIREYWIVDPDDETVEAHQLVDGKYAALKPDADGKIHSIVVPGWWIQPALLFRKPTPPDALELIQALGIV